MNMDPILKEIYQVVDNPLILNDLDANDLLSLKAQVQGIPDQGLDDLWALLLVRTSSLD